MPLYLYIYMWMDSEFPVPKYHNTGTDTFRKGDRGKGQGKVI